MVLNVSHLVLVSMAMLIAASFTRAADTTAPSTRPARQDADLAVMTFNIRYLNDHDGANGWELRKSLVIETIRDINPDLLGTQEVKPQQLAYLTEQLGDDYFIVAGQPANATPTGEHQAIFARKSRFELIEKGQHWLSETPDKPGSKGWDANLPRSFNYARLKDKQRDGKTVLYLNTHWDHIGEQARQNSGKLMAKWIAENAKGSEVVLTGDFNAIADSPAYQNLFDEKTSGMKLLDAYRVICAEAHNPEAGTFHGFTGKAKPGRIDWIVCTPALKAIDAGIDERHKGALYASDHFSVWAILRGEAKP